MTPPRMTGRKGWYFCIAALSVAFCISACSTRRVMVNGFVPLVDHGMPVFEQENDLLLLADAFPAHIKLLEMMAANDPGNPKLAVLRARLYGAYAFAILETRLEMNALLEQALPRDWSRQDPRQRVSHYFQKGIDCALRALEINHPDVRKQLANPRDASEFFQSTDPDDVPALFWYGFNLGFYVQHHLDAVDTLAAAHLVEKAMQRVIVLAPDYYQGYAHVVLMVYYSFRSPMMGGNPALAQKHYREHTQHYPEAFALRELFWARYTLVQRQDREGFVRVLNQLIRTSQAAGDSQGLLDRVAAVRAEAYLKAVDDLFDTF
jgi:hypothetical protein